MKPEDYWVKRMESLNDSVLGKGEAYISAQNAEYDKAMARIKKETDAWYGRLAKNNDIGMAEARKLLTAGELKEFKWTVEDYIKAGRENAVDQRWVKELENASAKAHITRLEELQTKMRQEVELLTVRRQKGTADTLGEAYKDGYNKGIYEVQRGVGQGIPFARLDGRQIDKVLAKPWAPDGRNFSARIWGERDKLLAELQTVLTQDLIRGEPSDKVIADFAKRMDVSKHAAERLIRTEAAFFSGQSRLEGYQQQGVKHYKFVATLDKRTSTPCRDLDGEIIPISEAKAGVNYPPVHAYCRSTTIPHFDEEDEAVGTGERTARGEDGKTYKVAGDITYKDWAAKHAPKDVEKKHVPNSISPIDIQQTVNMTDLLPLEPSSDMISSVEERVRVVINRRYNPRASYFIDLPGVSEEALDKITDVNREVARTGYNQAKETLVLLDHNSGDELLRLSGSINKIVFTDEMHKKLVAAKPRSIVLTHNHPKGTRVNVKDAVNLANYPALGSIIAVGHDGGVSSISSTAASADAVALNSNLKRVFEAVNLQLRNDRKYATMSKTAQDMYFDYLVLQQLAIQMGWVYGEDFSAAKGDPRI